MLLTLHVGAASGAGAPDQAVAAVELRSGTVEVPGGELFYDIAGSGPAVVLLHDGLLHRVMWMDQMEPLAAEWTVIRYDRRGYGKSSKPETEYSNIEDLLRLLDALGVERACLVGMSAGGGLALDFTLEHPDRVASLVLVGAVVGGMGHTDHFSRRGGYLSPEIRTDPVQFRRYWFEQDPYTVFSENTEVRNLAAGVLEANPQNLAPENSRLLQGAERPALSALGEISVPTLVIVGEHDIPDIHAHAGALAGGIPQSQRVVVYRSGHLVPMEQPQVFNRMVLDFLHGIDLFGLLEEGRLDEALTLVGRLRDRDQVPFSSEEINLRGYLAMRSSKLDRAIALFRIGAAARPDSWSAHENLGEAYRAAGQNELAMRSYRRSLELHPDNTNVSKRIRELEAALRSE